MRHIISSISTIKNFVGNADRNICNDLYAMIFYMKYYRML